MPLTPVTGHRATAISGNALVELTTPLKRCSNFPVNPLASGQTGDSGDLTFRDNLGCQHLSLRRLTCLYRWPTTTTRKKAETSHTVTTRRPSTLRCTMRPLRSLDRSSRLRISAHTLALSCTLMNSHALSCTLMHSHALSCTLIHRARYRPHALKIRKHFRNQDDTYRTHDITPGFSVARHPAHSRWWTLGSHV